MSVHMYSATTPEISMVLSTTGGITSYCSYFFLSSTHNSSRGWLVAGQSHRTERFNIGLPRLAQGFQNQIVLDACFKDFLFPPMF